MARTGRFNCEDMRRLQRELERLQRSTDAFLEECAKELAARLLRKVIKRTPVGQYPEGSGKTGGTLRRGWTAARDAITVHHSGNTYVIEITNPVEYASYVEYGHRTRNHHGWVPGRFMMTISEQEIQRSAPQILERKIKKFLGDVLR